MRGVGAAYPKFDPSVGRPTNLEQRINRCRKENQQEENGLGRNESYWR
jgi:hypothetical protein